MVLLASFPFLNLYLHEGPTRAFEAQWRGFVSSTFLREATREVLKPARQHQIQGWVGDDRQLGPARPADLDWAAAYAMPALIDIGVKRFAVLETEDPPNRLLIKNTADHVASALPIDIRRFGNIAEVRIWAYGP